jgi:hypothetical protein
VVGTQPLCDLHRKLDPTAVDVSRQNLRIGEPRLIGGWLAHLKLSHRVERSVKPPPFALKLLFKGQQFFPRGRQFALRIPAASKDCSLFVPET